MEMTDIIQKCVLLWLWHTHSILSWDEMEK